MAFYYDSKQSIPYKRALREHIQRKKHKVDPKWDATIQAALCVGAVVTAGSGPDKPLEFSLPQSDYTFSTRLFHPMQREIFDRITGTENTVAVQENSGKKRWMLFSVEPSARKFLTQKEPSRDSPSKVVAGDFRSVEGPLASLGKSRAISNSDKGNGVMKAPGPKKAPQKWSSAEKKAFFDIAEKHGRALLIYIYIYMNSSSLFCTFYSLPSFFLSITTLP